MAVRPAAAHRPHVSPRVRKPEGPSWEAGLRFRPTMVSARTTLARTAITIFVLLVIGFFVFALAEAWNATNGAVPSVPRLAAAAGLFAAGLLVGAFAWATLLGGNRRVDHVAAVLVTQLAKYVPGGVWQATGQVGLARAA